MDKSGENEPARMAVFSNRFRGLQQVIDLRQVRIGIAVVDQGVQKFRRFPD